MNKIDVSEVLSLVGKIVGNSEEIGRMQNSLFRLIEITHIGLGTIRSREDYRMRVEDVFFSLIEYAELLTEKAEKLCNETIKYRAEIAEKLEDDCFGLGFIEKEPEEQLPDNQTGEKIEKIKELRKRLNMTQQELAEKMSVSQGAIAMWETEKAIPSSDKLPLLAKVLNCEISELFNRS